MDEQLKTLLTEEIVDEFNRLRSIEVGTEQYKVTVDGLVKLYDRALDTDKAEAERTDKLEFNEKELEIKNRQLDEQIKSRVEEAELKRVQAEEERKDRIVKNVLTLLQIAIPTIVAVRMTYKTFEFEKEGTVTTILGRGWIGKLIPRK